MGIIDDELLTIGKAARLLALSETALLGIIKRGELPIVELSKDQIMVRRNDLEEYMVDHYRLGYLLSRRQPYSGRFA